MWVCEPLRQMKPGQCARVKLSWHTARALHVIVRLVDWLPELTREGFVSAGLEGHRVHQRLQNTRTRCEISVKRIKEKNLFIITFFFFF